MIEDFRKGDGTLTSDSCSSRFIFCRCSTATGTCTRTLYIAYTVYGPGTKYCRPDEYLMSMWTWDSTTGTRYQVPGTLMLGAGQ
jgi:hypothetical protein